MNAIRFLERIMDLFKETHKSARAMRVNVYGTRIKCRLKFANDIDTLEDSKGRLQDIMNINVNVT